MDLYVLRHASIGIRHDSSDVKRTLDQEGKQLCMLVGSYLNAMNVRFDLIASSPFTRARQTASLVGTEVRYERNIQVSEALSPGATIAVLQQYVDSFDRYQNVLIVGHNPNLAQFLGSLIGTPGRASIRMRKGTIARVDCTRRPGVLNWLVDPHVLHDVYTDGSMYNRRSETASSVF